MKWRPPAIHYLLFPFSMSEAQMVDIGDNHLNRESTELTDQLLRLSSVLLVVVAPSSAPHEYPINEFITVRYKKNTHTGHG